MRGAIVEWMKLLGKKMYAGDFQLTRTSFPIKCMAKNSQLEMQSSMHSTMSIYLNKAASVADPLERIKYFITQSISQ